MDCSYHRSFCIFFFRMRSIRVSTFFPAFVGQRKYSPPHINSGPFSQQIRCHDHGCCLTFVIVRSLFAFRGRSFRCLRVLSFSPLDGTDNARFPRYPIVLDTSPLFLGSEVVVCSNASSFLVSSKKNKNVKDFLSFAYRFPRNAFYLVAAVRKIRWNLFEGAPVGSGGPRAPHASLPSKPGAGRKGSSLLPVIRGAIYRRHPAPSCDKAASSTSVL